MKLKLYIYMYPVLKRINDTELSITQEGLPGDTLFEVISIFAPSRKIADQRILGNWEKTRIIARMLKTEPERISVFEREISEEEEAGIYIHVKLPH